VDAAAAEWDGTAAAAVRGSGERGGFGELVKEATEWILKG